MSEIPVDSSLTGWPLEGWHFGRTEEAEWMPWGSRGDARAKILAGADGYHVVLVEAQPGYRGDPHEHTNAEFSYVIEGTVRTQGEELTAGDGVAAAAGSTHDDFVTEGGATYLTIFKL